MSSCALLILKALRTRDVMKKKQECDEKPVKKLGIVLNFPPNVNFVQEAGLGGGSGCTHPPAALI